MPFLADDIVTALCRCEPITKLLSIACIFTLRQRQALGGCGLRTAARAGRRLALATAQCVSSFKMAAAASQQLMFKQPVCNGLFTLPVALFIPGEISKQLEVCDCHPHLTKADAGGLRLCSQSLSPDYSFNW